MPFPLLRQFPLATCAIVLACIATFPQQRSTRELAGINGPVRTVRVEGRQLHAVTHHQLGVMVYTVIYDDQGRPLETAEYLPGGNPDTKSTSVYDKRGNEIEHAQYVHDELNYRSITRYDARNRKVEELRFDATGKQTSRFIFQYDRRRRQLTVEMRPDGKMRRQSVAVLDERGNEVERIEFSESGAPKDRYVYKYNAAGKQTSEVQHYQMKGRARTSESTYVYDGLGNLLEKASYSDGALDDKETYTFDPRGNPTEAIETDSDGHVTAKRTWAYEFDDEGSWTRAVISEWTNKAPNAPFQPTYEYRRIFGRVNDATIALWSAAGQGTIERVRELLRLGADVNANHPDGGTSLIKAAARGHRDVVQVFLTSGAQVDRRDAEGWTALTWSAEFGRLDVVKLLLAAGADPNARNGVGGVAIMPAAQNGQIEVLKLLLEKGAEVNAAANDGSTALMVSVQNAPIELVEFLLSNGADPSMRTKDGLTALFFAVAGRKTDTVKALLERAVDVNASAKDGSSPLMVAAAQPETTILRLLIEKGADLNAKTDDGQTALSIAVNANRNEAAELLRKAGAR